MHCPKCNAYLEEVENDGLRCLRADWVYVKSDADLIKEKFGHQKSLVVPSVERDQESVGRWYCPGCGVLMDDGSCPVCSGVIDGKLLYRLVERNPHP